MRTWVQLHDRRLCSLQPCLVTQKSSNCFWKGRQNIDDKDDFGATTLFTAVRKGREAAVELLVASVADVNMTFGHSSAENGIIQIVKCLLDESADVNVVDFNGVTP